MKISLLAVLVCSVSAARIVMPEDYASSLVGTGGPFNKLEHNSSVELEPLSKADQVTATTSEKRAELMTAQVLSKERRYVDIAKDKLQAQRGSNSFKIRGEANANETLTEGALDFGDVMKACDKQDCKNKYFVNETLRWIKGALKDMRVIVYENPRATAALFIGVSILILSLSSGALISMALNRIGFGSDGPIAGTIASFIQKHTGDIKVGSVFAQLQSAAMGGAAMNELETMANLALKRLGTAVVLGGISSLGAGFEPVEWRNWEVGSRVVYSAELATKTIQLWGPLMAEKCIAYGYREYRAQVWFVPTGADPVEVCLSTPVGIKGVGLKTPLGCVNEGPKKGVIGTWYVQSNETQCMPRWSEFEDEGCMQYGRRRRFARLMGLHHQDDWNSVCESTPAHINNQTYSAATYCEDKGVLGIYGVFDIPDTKCECYCAST